MAAIHEKSSRQEISANFIDKTRYSVYDSMKSSAIDELRQAYLHMSPISISPLSPSFGKQSQEMQNQIRKNVAKIVFKPLNEAIDIALTDGHFDPQWFYDSCGLSFKDAGLPNPLPKPIEPAGLISLEELDTMRETAKKDPTNIRFLNPRLPYLPHSMRREFRRLGVTLLIIQNELVPQVAEKLEGTGIPRTYGKKETKKVEVILGQPSGKTTLTRIPDREPVRKIRRKRKDARKRGSIWSHY
ncbi:MAG TPA: hypothetical protein VKC89_02595 [Patescibacteria group bacterium]|nr:hypothetical protein [Patescibacteria group bacterium]